MNRTQVAAVLRAASAVDPRLAAPDDDTLTAWAAQLDDVPVEVAQEAIRVHYRQSARAITPADIVRHWRVTLRDAGPPAVRPPRSYLLVLPNPRLPPAELRATTAELARKTGIPPLGHCSIRLLWTVPDGHHGDPEHLAASVQACADGLVDAGIAALVIQRTPEIRTDPRLSLAIAVKPESRP
ncbi:hypothetical protein [Saccharothrix australiensis]|uniref:Uncharacterized protein n=1 Tax=Saccharothrix australiensis TaxID=2072 RepID=A0A495VUE8_9PSEU|nr:hypothetical protein [Saccharothrix australiensis]RKT52055.1 hypothetical protein C8E97_0553 [Saccharothrix australiensis]